VRFQLSKGLCFVLFRDILYAVSVESMLC